MEEEKEKETKIRTVQEIEEKLKELRDEYKYLDNMHSIEHDFGKITIKNKYNILEWILNKEYCLVCGRNHNNRSWVCSEECSMKLYGWNKPIK